jgi:hypothetical protein
MLYAFSIIGNGSYSYSDSILKNKAKVMAIQPYFFIYAGHCPFIFKSFLSNGKIKILLLCKADKIIAIHLSNSSQCEKPFS